MQRVVLLAFVMFAACASGPASRPPRTTLGTPDPSASANPVDPDVTCTQEVPTGSNFEATVCRTDAEREMDRRAAEDLYRGPNAHPHI
jgi:hypothetical protein